MIIIQLLLLSISIQWMTGYSSFASIGNQVSSFFSSIREELRFRKTPDNQYVDQISSALKNSVKDFRQHQKKFSDDAKRELDMYVNQTNYLYTETLRKLKKQQDSLDNLTSNEKFQRPKRFDISLEEFRKQFNETKYGDIMQDLQHYQQKFRFDPIDKQMNRLNQVWIKNWEELLKSSDESTKTTENFVKDTLKDLTKWQDEFLNTAKKYETFPQTLTKKDIRQFRNKVDTHFKNLEKNGTIWLDENFKKLDTSMRNLQERIKRTETLYEDLIGKRRASMHYTFMNDLTLNKVLNMIDPKDKGWKLVRTEDGVEVYRKFMGMGTLGSQYACVRCTHIINSHPDKVFALFEDSTRAKEYNTLFAKEIDLATVAENTKIVWSSSTPVFPFKARDFCTIIHFRKLKDGTRVVLNRCTTHPDAPKTNKYVRAAIILGANIIQPIPGKSNSCKVTMITQVDPGGFTPPMIVNSLCSAGPIGFMKNIEVAAKKKPSKKALEEKKKIAAIAKQNKR